MKQELVEWEWCGLPYNAYDAKSGARVVEIHYSADPEKDQAWAAELKRTAAIPEPQWRREMELDVTIHDGVPVFPEFDAKIHAVKGPIPVLNDPLLVGGWDCGVGLVTTFVLVQIEPSTYQFQILAEVQSAPNEPMALFAPRVAREMRELLGPKWNRVQHYGDPAGAARTGTTGKSAYVIADEEAGINIRKSTNGWEGRRSAVSNALTDWATDEVPRFVLDAGRCPILYRGFLGAYELRTQRDESGPSAVWKPVPLKNAYSHVQDALQYALMTSWKLVASLAKNESPRRNLPTFADIHPDVLRAHGYRADGRRAGRRGPR